MPRAQAPTYTLIPYLLINFNNFSSNEKTYIAKCCAVCERRKKKTSSLYVFTSPPFVVHKFYEFCARFDDELYTE